MQALLEGRTRLSIFCALHMPPAKSIPSNLLSVDLRLTSLL